MNSGISTGLSSGTVIKYMPEADWRAMIKKFNELFVPIKDNGFTINYNIIINGLMYGKGDIFYEGALIGGVRLSEFKNDKLLVEQHSDYLTIKAIIKQK
ncbi:MAG: hypothetical protein EOM23_11570 [Candidatus Moranbacteria bacterium]|nr:hypothetical protein [Candidatus Moranbacteria bacterium]